jgi:hypothetical protein
MIVTKAWNILTLWIEERASTYGRQLQIYRISNSRQPIRGGPPTWDLNRKLTASHHKKKQHVTK